jgi:alkaline phosphatase
LIIVTADHSHVFTIAGYPKRGNPILGKVVGTDSSGEPRSEPTLAADELPYTTLGYANGRVNYEPPEHDTADAAHSLQTQTVNRSDLSQIDTTDESFRPEALVPMNSETHAGEDVAIYAAGPGSDLVRGVMEQHVIFHVMMEASKMGTRQ